MSEVIRSLGLCLGASTISLVCINRRTVDSNHRQLALPQITGFALYPHDGNPRQTLYKALECIDLGRFDRIAATGRKFRQQVNLTSIAEPEAVEYAYNFTKPKGIHCPAIIAAGGETFMVYVVDHAGRITNVLTGNKCAAGTGEFFLQQLRRMDVSLDEAAQWADTCEPYTVSGRCSVFCKSDCTHATNKGIPKSRVTAGLGRMMAGKILELLKKVERRNLMLTGGASRNRMMTRYLHEAIPGLIVPEQAPYFEALGAALWALDHSTRAFPGQDKLFRIYKSCFKPLEPLINFNSQVTFKNIARDAIRNGDECILGLDVGSTTTKAVLIRRQDNSLLADIYLRTNSDPVAAARACYRAILSQVQKHADPERITITSLGVCGSGRQIVGLHAQTEGVINEIIAHATAAVYFDRDVDTIFEIGGQDAKYTYITNGVASDYAMNEACSAGTGSFLEESAFETLGVPMADIAQKALQGCCPPNFNDQCAAFIASDIKNAIHDGVAHEDIVAGLVYSICMNYNNRVKGNRPVGAKVFMQGGVCYNRAVPLAMAALTGKSIIVPPEPGLMGAFGAALEIKKRLTAGLMHPSRFDLAVLAERRVRYKPSFVCRGGTDKCDRGCEICRIQINGKTFPFGGACNRYDNLRGAKHRDRSRLDLVRERQILIFEKYAPAPLDPSRRYYRGRIGINRSFLTHTYYPLYAHFFSALGFDPILPDKPDPLGIDLRNAPFCYPGELAHGFFHHLIRLDDLPEHLFLPHFKSIPALNGDRDAQLCPLVQGEPFYLKTTFRKQLNREQKKGLHIHTPLLNLNDGLNSARQPLIAVARQMGISRRVAEHAFDQAMAVMQACLDEMKVMGRKALSDIELNPDRIAVVLFGRPYNAYAKEAHMGIPAKFASRGVLVLPLDFLDFSDQPSKRYMYWGMGQRILMAAHMVKAHPQLFGTFITNFSCGPDSFVVSYFRDLMGRKPSLTLELDSHTADAGLETRIEAFLDIVHAHRQLSRKKTAIAAGNGFKAARLIGQNGSMAIATSDGQTLALTDPRVTLLMPSMGRLGSQALAAAFRGADLSVQAHPPSNESILKLGRGYTTCKECLPLILTTGTLLDYIQNHKQPNEVLLYFMPNGAGPCRFGQYHIFMEDLVHRLQIPNVAMFSISADDGYGGVPARVHRLGWWGVVVSDVFEDMRSMLLANAQDKKGAMAIFKHEYQQVLTALESGRFDSLQKALANAAHCLAQIPLIKPVHQVPRISLTGEIFVRRDGLSRQYLTEHLAAKGFAAVCAPVAEWILYSDYIVNKKLTDYNHESWRDKLKAHIKQHIMRNDEKRIKSTLSASGLIHAEPIDIPQVINTARPYISPYLGGEAILTIGSSLKEVAIYTCGVICIGPFGCMPNRLAEAILNETMKSADKLASEPRNRYLRATLSHISDLPFLAIESDGAPFPQLTHAKLEAFCLQAERLHARMQKD